MLVDIESSIDVFALKCLNKLQYNEKDLEAVKIPIVGFREQVTHHLGTKRLHV